MNADPMKPAPPVTKILRMLRNREKNWTGFARKVSIRLLLCAISACSVPLWLFFLSNNEPQRHRARRGCTEKSVYAHFRAKPIRPSRKLTVIKSVGRVNKHARTSEYPDASGY